MLPDGVQLGGQLGVEGDAAAVAEGHRQADDFVRQPQHWHVGGALAQSAAAAGGRGRRRNLREGGRRADAVRTEARAARLLVQGVVIFDQRRGFSQQKVGGLVQGGRKSAVQGQAVLVVERVAIAILVEHVMP